MGRRPSKGGRLELWVEMLEIFGSMASRRGAPGVVSSEDGRSKSLIQARGILGPRIEEVTGLARARSSRVLGCEASTARDATSSALVVLMIREGRRDREPALGV